jgi:RNA polymerase sigma factor (sigma-70 family)
MLSARRFRPQSADGEANSWLFGILTHKLAGFERRGAVERRGRQALRLTTPPLSEEEFDDARGPLAMTALQALPADQRDAVRARVIDERPYAEVAAALKISEANARQRVSRGLAAIRTAFQKETP